MPPMDAGITLPDAVRPWAMLGWSQDQIKLVGVDTFPSGTTVDDALMTYTQNYDKGTHSPEAASAQDGNRI
eukprot:5745824-Prymnesium_polylepis.1